MLMNVTPSNPRIVADDADNLACTVRVHDPDHPQDAVQNPGQSGMALPLWITALLRWDGRTWSAPRVVSASGDHPETAYGLACAAGGLLVAEPVLDAVDRHPPRMHRIEVHAVDGALPPLHAGGSVADACPCCGQTRSRTLRSCPSPPSVRASRRQRTQPGKLLPAMLRYSGPGPSFV